MLDLYPVQEGVAPSQVIHDAAHLAQRAEALGYLRYWVAEHHNMPGIASAAPEVLITYIAGKTKTIRVGAGGIMLPNHSPLHVLEVFRTMEALYPNRIDMGIGRAPGTDPVTSSALQRGDKTVNQQIAELNAFIHNDFPTNHPFAKIVAMPNDITAPPMWMLGSTTAGAQIAATLGVGFAFAGHFSMEHAPAALAVYHREFVSSKTIQKPYAILALSVTCADTDEQAEALAAPMRLVLARIARGQTGPFPSVATALAHKLTPAELTASAGLAAGMIVGGPAKVKARLQQVVAELQPNELMISTNIANLEQRVRSYELVSQMAHRAVA